MKNAKKSIGFYGVSNDKRTENKILSNLVYYVCKALLLKSDKITSIYDIDKSFKPHQQICNSDIKNSVINKIMMDDVLVFLIDEYYVNTNEVDFQNGSNKLKIYNPNVWFELGLAAPTDKVIIPITISIDNPPFYLTHKRTIRFPEYLLDKYITDSGCCFNKDSDSDMQDEASAIIAILDKNDAKDKNDKEILEKFYNELIQLILNYQQDLLGGLSQLMQIAHEYNYEPLGCGNLTKMLKAALDNAQGTNAFFIDNEQEAFEELKRHIDTATLSIRTTRFANRSIVSNHDTNDDATLARKKFMDTLCEKSKTGSGVTSIRIISNNDPLKWKDVKQILLKGDNATVYIRKEEYYSGFELVIIDEKTTFIHFYLPNNSKENEDRKQVINSTLKLTGRDISERMSKVFDRIFERQTDDPSRTLLGIDKNKFSETKEHGKLHIEPKTNVAHLYNVENTLVNCFQEWTPHMQAKDFFYMAAGLILCLEDDEQKENVKKFIKSDQNRIDVFKNEYEEYIAEVTSGERELSSTEKRNLNFWINELNKTKEEGK